MENRFEMDEGRSDGRGFIEKTIYERSAEWGRQVETTGESLRTIGKQLRSLGAVPAADLAERVADYACGCGMYLQEADIDRLLHDAETFAREQPMLVAGAGFIIGMVGARMLKVGSTRRYERYGDQPSWQT
jgi:fumarylacetoacetate (FAA) hydrolase family protein